MRSHATTAIHHSAGTTGDDRTAVGHSRVTPIVDDADFVPHLPDIVSVESTQAPAAPIDVEATGVARDTLRDLTLKLGSTVHHFTTQWMVEHLHLPQLVVEELLHQLSADHLIEVLGSAGPIGFRYALSQRGRGLVERLLEISSYVGPAPVSLATYSALLDWEMERFPEVRPDRVAAALTDMVLTPEDAELGGLAMASGRSLFIYGPPGNGKSTLGRRLHQAVGGEIWVPHSIVVDNSIIRIYDPQIHQVVELPPAVRRAADPRWVRIRRPMIVAGGEMTIETCDLIYRPTLRYYEAPMHFKANGGTFFIDDFGRQRVDPYELLNRWIIPLEQRIDYLTLHTGKKIQVPFRIMLIIATNFEPAAVTDAAFLRRMGYRLQLGHPSPDRYVEILRRCAARHQVETTPVDIDWLLSRYRDTGREMRACEPNDLIERCRDICRFRKQPLQLNREVLETAWKGYFGNDSAGDGAIVRGKSSATNS